MIKITKIALCFSFLILNYSFPASAQVSKETLESITTPEKVETSIGTLNFMDGAPSPETAQKVYDYLDTMRAWTFF